MSFYRSKEFRSDYAGNADEIISKSLQHLKKVGRIRDMGVSGRDNWYQITDEKWSNPDRVWKAENILAYWDGEQVHPLDDPWDILVKKTLEKKGFKVLRERYRAPLTNWRLHEILGDVVDALDSAKLVTQAREMVQ